MKKGRILAVDDNAGIRSTLKILLPAYFEEVKIIASPNTIMSELENFAPHVVLLDMNFKAETNTGNEGLFWITEIKKHSPKTQVVLFTAYADVQLAVEGMKRGAFDFVVKPWDNKKFITTLSSACEAAMKDANDREVVHADEGDMYWGNSPQMESIKKTIEKIAPTDASVLITGENGTGKDVLAKQIHRLSRRKNKEMTAVDAGAITETLFESELFGHVKGAFTDAKSDHAGKFELADNSTLFLDEIGNIPLHLQAKLLRAIQNKKITRVGDTKEIPVDIRLICATNVNLEKLVSSSQFREDLFYRINTVHISLPPLRERPDDILPLAERFVAIYNQKYNRHINGISPECAKKLRQNPWNGNIRELQNAIEKAVILSENDILTPGDFVFVQTTTQPVQYSVGENLESAEKQVIINAMEKYAGNLSLVAKSLNISRPTLYSKLKKYGI
ncbi:MAG: sigma-54-dependent Fis family transcriptional regulator [Bacteroidales bacterium]|nr:sigma-54-dependent Fis family transcriptional regulator [Bacteroidales bacterium]